MNSHKLFPQIGKVIASTGSRYFPRLLHDLIQSQMAVDATHIRQLRIEAHPSKDATLLSETVFSGAGADCARTGGLARLDLMRRTDDYRYEITLYRADPLQGFSAQDRSRGEAISPLLLAMFEKHAHALKPVARPTALPSADRPLLPSVESRFIHRLRQNGLVLSRRELEVCVGLLTGHTAPELAERLDLKVNTVESYLKRAVIKLGVGGRNALMRWMYGVDTEVSRAGQVT